MSKQVKLYPIIAVQGLRSKFKPQANGKQFSIPKDQIQLEVQKLSNYIAENFLKIDKQNTSQQNFQESNESILKQKDKQIPIAKQMQFEKPLIPLKNINKEPNYLTQQQNDSNLEASQVFKFKAKKVKRKPKNFSSINDPEQVYHVYFTLQKQSPNPNFRAYMQNYSRINNKLNPNETSADRDMSVSYDKSLRQQNQMNSVVNRSLPPLREIVFIC
eukprot:403335749